MIIDVLKILVPYFSGIIVAFIMFHPLKEWDDGYKTAKERYNNWDLGFDEGYKYAEKRFKNYDDGFGNGFESGWNAAVEYYKQEEE